MNQEMIIRILADGLMIPIVLIGTYALVFKVPKEKRLESYTRVLIAGLTTYLIAKLAGTIYQPETLRPFELLGSSAGASYLNNPGFPSDHALFAMAITCAVWFETKQKLMSIILVSLVICMALGRVLALVHTPIDVFGGIVIAIIGSFWYLNE